MRWTALLALVLPALAPALAEAGDQQPDTVREREACVARHFGDPDEIDSSISRSLVVRMTGEANAEWQVSIKERGEEGVVVEVVSARRGSVRDQLERLGRRFPRLSPAERCERLTVCQKSVAQGDLVDAARAILDEAVSAKFGLVSQTPLFLDERVYEVWVTSFPNTGRFWLTAPAGQPTEDPLGSFVFRVVRKFGELCPQSSPTAGGSTAESALRSGI